MAYPHRLFTFEVVQQLELLKTKQEKIDFLRVHNTAALRDLIRCSLDPRIEFLLPEGAPPYAPPQPHNTPSNWIRQNVKLAYFVKGSPKAEATTQVKRERIFLDVLESIHPEDALLLIAAKDKKKLTKGLTKALVNEAFPGLIP
jgi:hypothetical protein